MSVVLGARRLAATVATATALVATTAVGAAVLGATSATAASAPAQDSSLIAGQSGHDYVVNRGAVALRTPDEAPAPARSLGRMVAGRSTNAQGVAVYDVNVLAVDSGADKHGTSAGESQRMVEKLAAEYSRETGGALQFRFASYQVLPATTATLCGTGSVEERYERQIAALSRTAGATDATWVVVTAESGRCDYAAEGFLGSAGVHMNGHWGSWTSGNHTSPISGVDVMPLAHEVTHNLGLKHAARATGASAFALPFRYSEYGDNGSVMGSSQGVRLSAADRAALGLLPANRVAVSTGAQTSQRVALGPFTDASTNDLLVVPVAGARAYLVEHRVVNGRGTVEVRTNDGLLDSLGSARTGTESILVPSPAALSNPSLAPGWTSGTITLPGGIRITLGAVSGARAEVTVTRAADRTAPSGRIDTCRGGKRVGNECTVATGSANYRVSLSATTTDDAVFLAATTLRVNGTVRATVANEVRSGSLARPWFQAAARTVNLSLGPGRHTIEVARTDLAGNTSVQRSVVRVQARKAKAPRKPMWVEARQSGHAKRVKVSWIGEDFPRATGTAPRNRFRVTLTAPGARSVTRTVAGTREQVTVPASKAGRWKVSVQAINTSGRSGARAVQVTVR